MPRSKTVKDDVKSDKAEETAAHVWDYPDKTVAFQDDLADTANPPDPDAPPPAKPEQIEVTERTVRSDNDVLIGRWCDVVKGDHEGRYGAYDQTASYGKDGYPKTVVVRTRDDNHEYLTVNYADIRPSVPGKR